MRGRETQNPVNKFETYTPEKPLAKAALVGVDVIFEEPVDDDECKECQAEPHQHRHAVEFDPGEERHGAPIGNIDREMHEELRCVRPFEAVPLDRPIDDLFGQIEGEKIGDHGQGHDQQNEKLLPPRVRPDITRKALFHIKLL